MKHRIAMLGNGFWSMGLTLGRPGSRDLSVEEVVK